MTCLTTTGHLIGSPLSSRRFRDHDDLDLFAIVSRRKISLKQRQLIMTDMNQPKLSGIVRMIRTTFTIILVCQVVAGTIFAVYFHLYGYYDNWRDAIFYGFYQAISAVTNSGFDVTGNSILPFSHDYFFLTCIMILILSGIGFPVIMDFREWVLLKQNNAAACRFAFLYSQNCCFGFRDPLCRRYISDLFP